MVAQLFAYESCQTLSWKCEGFTAWTSTSALDSKPVLSPVHPIQKLNGIPIRAESDTNRGAFCTFPSFLIRSREGIDVPRGLNLNV